jgi:hypothetical protein
MPILKRKALWIEIKNKLLGYIKSLHESQLQYLYERHWGYGH